MKITDLIIYIGTYAPLITIFASIPKYQLATTAQKLLFWMVVVISANVILSEFLLHVINIKNNLPLYRGYILIEFIFLSIIYNRFFNTGKVFYILLFIQFTFLIGFITTNLNAATLFAYPTYSRFAEGLIIISFAGRYFWKIFKQGKVISLHYDFGFWLSVGVFIYFASNSLLFIFSEFILYELSPRSFDLIWTIHAILTILLYITYTIAIRCKTSPNLS